MGRLLGVLILCGCARRPIAGPAMAPGATADALGRVTIQVPADAAQRALDESAIMPLITQDFINQGKGIIDLALRKRIAAIMRRLEREQ